MDDLAGKVAFITGAAAGIGLGMARAFAPAGIRLVLADINAERLALAVAELRGGGADVLGVDLNVADIASWEAARRKTEDRFGSIDILCNNAGVAPANKKFEDIPDEDWNWIFSINVHGVRNGIKTWLPSMKANGRPGHIVNTSSVLGLFATANAADYVACKFAVIGLSETLRMELADSDIGVSVLCPGFVRTTLAQDRAVHKELTGLKLSGHEAPKTRAGDNIPLDPDRVGRDVLIAIREDRFYVLPHPEYAEVIDSRYNRIRGEYRLCSPTGEDLQGLGGCELQLSRDWQSS